MAKNKISSSGSLKKPVKIHEIDIYNIRNKKTGLYMEIPDGSKHPMVTVKQDKYNGNISQSFRLRVIDTRQKIYEIIPMANEWLRLDVMGGNPANNVPIWTFDSNNTEAQRFKIIQENSGDLSYKILTEKSEFKRGISIGKTADSIIQNDIDEKDDNNYWYFETAHV